MAPDTLNVSRGRGVTSALLEVCLCLVPALRAERLPGDYRTPARALSGPISIALWNCGIEIPKAEVRMKLRSAVS